MSTPQPDDMDVLLDMIGLKEKNIPRFRSVYRVGNEIEIVTRTGANNHYYYDSPWKRERYRKQDFNRYLKQCLRNRRNPKKNIDYGFIIFPSRFKNFPERGQIPINKYRKAVEQLRQWHDFDPFAIFDHIDGPWADCLRRNPYYLHDEDDDFDCTYCHFRFSLPAEYHIPKEQIEDPLTPWQIRNMVLEAMKEDIDQKARKESTCHPI